MKRAPYSKDRCKALCGGCCEQSCPRVSTFIIPGLTKHQEVGKWIQNLRETRGTMAWDPAQKEKSGLDGSQRLHRCVTCFILSRSVGTGKRRIGWDWEIRFGRRKQRRRRRRRCLCHIRRTRMQNSLCCLLIKTVSYARAQTYADQ